MANELDDILGISANFDVKVETLAATLLAQADGSLKDFGIEQIVVSAKGDERRRVGKDVEEVKKKYYDHEIALFIETNRKGLFDTLPNRLFLRLEEEYKDPKTRTKAITQQIKEARKFFLPFEQAIYHPRIEAEQLEQKYTESFPDFIHKIWGFPEFKDCLSDRQKFLLCYLIPEAYRVVGNWKLTELIFEAVLQKPIEVTFVAPKELKNPNADKSMDSMRIGEDSVIGSTFKDDIPTLEVKVKGVTYADLKDYLASGKKRKLLEELLYSYFIPLDISVETKIIVTDDSFRVTVEDWIIGYNIKLLENVDF